MLYPPMLTTVDKETFSTNIKSQSHEERRRTSAQIPVCMQYNTTIDIYYCKLYTLIQYRGDNLLSINICILEYDILTPDVYYCVNTVYTVQQYVRVAMCAF